MRLIRICILLTVLHCVYVTALCNNLHIIKKSGEDIFISSKTDDKTDILYWFKRCMYNDIYTFYRVGMIHNTGILPVSNPDTVPDVVLNLAVSDNIGPFDIENGGWCGGNHSYTDGITKTAVTENVSVFADGKEINNDTVAYAKNIRIEVRNYIFNPVRTEEMRGTVYFPDTLCVENVEYSVAGNNIQVGVAHDYINKIPVTVTRYYGMQSMFCNETEILTPDGKYSRWTDIDSVSRFNKKEYKDFRRFVEKNYHAYQSAWLSGSGLGAHSGLSKNDVIFIGNSSGKSYHKLISGKIRKKGCNDSWSGVYTWFRKPLYEDDKFFIYEGMINNKPVLFISSSGEAKCVIKLPADFLHGSLKITGPVSSIKIGVKNKDMISVYSSKNSCCILQRTD